MLNALYRPEVEGLEHVPTDAPAILASNHPSTVDVVFMPSVLARPVYFLAKSEYFSGLSRHFFSNVGVIPVARDGGDAAEASLRKAQEILEAGNLLGIYPEGTRSPDGRLYRGKTGPVRLALRTGAPLVPVAMHGTYDVMPPGARVPRIRRVGVRFGAPLDLSRYAGRAEDRFALRGATDELMYELMLLSGQQYVDAYAATVKAKGGLPSTLDDLGQLTDEDAFEIPKAS
jgi:1-acyl-sn-glycerol-3-phosphate acyltransferase